jgi:hypothetical protein
MAYKKKDYYNNNNLVNQLIAEREKRLKEIQKKVNAYLENKKYFDFSAEQKVEFLLSVNGLALIEGMAREDLTTVEIATTLGVTQKDLHKLSRENPDIYDAIDRGRAEKINLVEAALFEMARDRVVEEEYLQEHWSARTPDNKSYSKNVKKRVIPANFQAAQYILNVHKNMEYRKQLEDQIDMNKERVVFKIEMPEIDIIKEKVKRDE